MADASSTIFNKHAAEKLRSADDLEQYVRLTTPGMWAVVVACILLLQGLLAWSIFGTITTGLTTQCSYVEGTVSCFLSEEDASHLDIGDEAFVSGHKLTVKSVSKLPISRDEAWSYLFSDYLVRTLVKDDWVYVVEFEGDVKDLPKDVPLTIDIVFSQEAPISQLFN